MSSDSSGTPAEHGVGTRTARRLGALFEAASWIWLVLVGVIGLSVVLRYAFASGRIELEELQWHLHAVGFLLGIVACTLHDRHVRVDVLRERMRPRTRAWVDLYGILLLQLPFLALVLWSAVPFVVDSWVVGERSASAGGLPFRWLLKSALPLAFAALVGVTILRLRGVARTLFGDESNATDPPSRRPAPPSAGSPERR